MSIMVAPLDGKARSLTCRGSLGGVPGGFWQAAWKRWCHRHALEQPYRHSIMTRQGSRFFAWRSNAARERVQIIRERLGMKQILIVSTSPRKGGNSDILADEFARGAREAGHTVEKVCLCDKAIQFCKGCLACQKTRRCVIDDDVQGIVEAMKRADAVVFATPVYYYAMSGQMKTLLDRTNPLFPAEYAFRDVYLLTSSADASESAADGVVNGLKGWIACFDKCRLKGVVRGTGVTAPGDIRRHASALEAAHALGLNA